MCIVYFGCVLVTQPCLTLCNPMDCSPPGSSVHGIFQARLLEWVTISSSRVSSQPRDQTWVSCIELNMPANFENSAVATGLEKVSFHPVPKKGNVKECSNYHTIVFVSHASKVMLKILQAKLQQYMNCELPEFQAGFRKGRGTRDQIANICWIIEKAREFQKKHLLLLY